MSDPQNKAEDELAGTEQPFVAHLVELRDRLIRMLLAIAVAAIALGLSEKGKKVHLTTTDPAAHLKFVIDESSGITMTAGHGSRTGHKSN